jgi:hypothetical protein
MSSNTAWQVNASADVMSAAQKAEISVVHMCMRMHFGRAAQHTDSFPNPVPSYGHHVQNYVVFQGAARGATAEWVGMHMDVVLIVAFECFACCVVVRARYQNAFRAMSVLQGSTNWNNSRESVVLHAFRLRNAVAWTHRLLCSQSLDHCVRVHVVAVAVTVIYARAMMTITADYSVAVQTRFPARKLSLQPKGHSRLPTDLEIPMTVTVTDSELS